jgi:hypothetical protein
VLSCLSSRQWKKVEAIVVDDTIAWLVQEVKELQLTVVLWSMQGATMPRLHSAHNGSICISLSFSPTNTQDPLPLFLLSSLHSHCSSHHHCHLHCTISIVCAAAAAANALTAAAAANPLCASFLLLLPYQDSD